MELRTVDPRALLFNPNNPRRTKSSEQADAEMVASIAQLGVLQPPLVQVGRDGDGQETLTIVFGERRTRGAIAANRATIEILVRTDADAVTDPMDAIAENIVRAEMGPVDRWRAMEALATAGWTDAAIGAALSVTPRGIAQLRLLGRICQPMLDRMAQGDMPHEGWLRTIAAAQPDAQLAVWKQHKPKKNERADWYNIQNALSTRRLYARNASFGDDEAAAFGIVWEEDLFAPADQDSRATTQLEAYQGAQQAWLDTHLPKNGVIVPIHDGDFCLPKGAKPAYGKPGKGDKVAHAVDPRSGQIITRVYTPAEVLKKAKAQAATVTGNADDASGSAGNEPVAKTRPDVTQKGTAIIGDLRTDALHQALREQPIDDTRLIALLVLALGSKNVSVLTGVKGGYGSGAVSAAAQTLIVDHALYDDQQPVRDAAREVLIQVLSCREDQSNSGVTARIAGAAIGADGFLVSMATTDFLPCMTKTALGREADAVGVRVEPRGKDTQANLIERFKTGTWVYPGARFAITETEMLAERAAEERTIAIQARWASNRAEHASGDADAECEDAHEDADISPEDDIPEYATDQHGKSSETGDNDEGAPALAA